MDKVNRRNAVPVPEADQGLNVSVERIQELTSYVSDAVRQVAEARTKLFRVSAENCSERSSSKLGVPDSHLLSINTVTLDWSYQYVRRGERILLIFFRRAKPSQTVLEASLRLELNLAPEDHLSNAGYETVNWSCEILVPHCLMRCTPGVVKFAVGPSGRDRLSLRNFQGNSGEIDAELTYLVDGQEVPTRHPDGTWKFAPFLAWLDAMRQWVQDPVDQASWQTFDSPLMQLSHEADQPQTQVLLANIMRAYVATKVEAEQPGEMPGLLKPFAWRQNVSKFEGRIRLLLDRKGQRLAHEPEEDPIALSMEYKCTSDRDSAKIRLRIYPPDFLVGGQLHRLIIEKLAEQAVRDGCSGSFRMGDWKLTFDNTAMREFILGNGAKASILKVGEVPSSHDETLITVSGKATAETPEGLTEFEAALVFQAAIKVVESQVGGYRVVMVTPHTRIDHNRNNRNRYRRKKSVVLLRPRSRQDETDSVRADLVESLIEQMVAIHRWGGVLP